MDNLVDLLGFPFVQRALYVGALVSAAAALLGVVLVLKRYSLIGHGLADVGFASLTIGLALGWSPLWVSLPVVVAAAILIMWVSQRYGASGDVAIGVASTGALAVGVIVASQSKGFNIDVYNYMFGSILALDSTDLLVTLVLAAAVFGLFVLFYNRIFLVSHDEVFARACGINVSFYHFLIAVLTAVTVVVGMRMMGTLLISSLIIFPAIIARRLTSGFLAMAAGSVIVAIVCFFGGMGTSLALDWPSGASVVVANVVVFILVLSVSGIARAVLPKK